MPQFVGPDAAPDKYRLVDLVGGGGEAELWRAEVTLAGHGETVALKVLRPEHVASFAKLSGRWAEQAELLRFVTHPHVVGVREHFEGAPPHPEADRSSDERELYLVMNWVEGETLRERVRRHARPDAADLRLLGQVGEALELLHAGTVTPSGRAIVHGDLSPGNVMIAASDRAVLVDFGLVRLVGHHTLTAAGTPGYAAPEVWLHGEYSPATDRYAFAALTVLVLTGDKPSPDSETTRVALAASPLVSGPRAVDTIMAALGSDPGGRPGPRELLAAVSADDERTVPASARTLSAPAPTMVEDISARRRERWLAAAALAAVVVIGLVLFLTTDRAASPGATLASPTTEPVPSTTSAPAGSSSPALVPGLAPVGFDTSGAPLLNETPRGTRVRVPANSSIDLDSTAADWAVGPIAASDQGNRPQVPGAYDLVFRGQIDAVDPISGAPMPTLEGSRIYSDPSALSYEACSAASADSFYDRLSPANNGTMCVRTDQEHLAAVRVASFSPSGVDLEIVTWR